MYPPCGQGVFLCILCSTVRNRLRENGGVRGFSTAALCFVWFLLGGPPCRAATIQPIKGDLAINQGQGFHKIDTATEVKVGDTVMVSPGGSAVVFYPDGCKVRLRPGAVMVIRARSPCASGSHAQESDANSHVANNIVLGAAVLGLTGVVIYEISQSSKTTPPASP